MTARSLLPGCLWALAACSEPAAPDGGDADADADADADTDADTDGDGDAVGPITLDGPCADAALVGQFVIEAQSEFSLVDGAVADAVLPTLALEEVGREGDCRLLERQNPFCDPPCGAGQTCDAGGECVPFPTHRDLGRVEVTGLREPVAMDPLQPGNRYSFTDLPNPAFEPGAELRLRAADVGLALDGLGFAPLQPGDDEWAVAAGGPLAIRWDAPAVAAATVVRLRVAIDQHGNTPWSLVCELPDTGSATIPASLVDAMLDAGVSGYPSGQLSRTTIDSAAVDGGCVELRVSSPRNVPIAVSGHRPCERDEDCPEPERCDVGTNTCR